MSCTSSGWCDASPTIWWVHFGFTITMLKDGYELKNNTMDNGGTQGIARGEFIVLRVVVILEIQQDAEVWQL
jgi:hypothetical protein